MNKKKPNFIKRGLAAAAIGIVVSTAIVPTAHAGLLLDSAGKNAIDSAESDIKEIGGATVLVSCIIWGFRATRRI